MLATPNSLTKAAFNANLRVHLQWFLLQGNLGRGLKAFDTYLAGWSPDRNRKKLRRSLLSRSLSWRGSFTQFVELIAFWGI
jgi:hypothetical protein